MAQYSIGIDYGTLSARTLLIDIQTGKEIAQCSFNYQHGVMDKELPCGIKLGDKWALQHPQDYIDALIYTIKDVVEKSNVDVDNIVGIGVDFTSCTILPTKKDGTPLCFLEEFKNEPHAYVKLWKHHAAQYCADILNETAISMNQKWLDYYGGKISCEWVVPKVMQIVNESPKIYEAADKIIEAGDFIVWYLTGKETRSACNAGYKALWHHKTGYPSKDFFKALDPMLENFVEEKLSTDIYSVGSCAGYISQEVAKLTGLSTKTAVAVGIIDAHASVPACGIDKQGKMLMIMGTSTCHMLLSAEEEGVCGTCGIVKDGIIPGYYAYEAGQSCVGDHFSWYMENCLPYKYYKEAQEKSESIFELMKEKVSSLKAGESGLVALDWWNGVRSTLMDFDLSGLIVGMTLKTKPEEIYMALIEATAYGTRNIIEAFEKSNIKIDELYAAGGIASKDEVTMQIYADVCNKKIKITNSAQAGAYGSAIFGVLAAFPNENPNEIIERLGKIKDVVYIPNKNNIHTYDKLYEKYKVLHNYFGIEQNNIMKDLQKIKSL